MVCLDFSRALILFSWVSALGFADRLATDTSIAICDLLDFPSTMLAAMISGRWLLSRLWFASSFLYPRPAGRCKHVAEGIHKLGVGYNTKARACDKMVVAQLVTALARGALDCLPILAKLDSGCLWHLIPHDDGQPVNRKASPTMRVWLRFGLAISTCVVPLSYLSAAANMS